MILDWIFEKKKLEIVLKVKKTLISILNEKTWFESWKKLINEPVAIEEKGKVKKVEDEYKSLKLNQGRLKQAKITEKKLF